MGRPKLVDGFDPEKMGVNPFVANLTVFASKKRVEQSMVNLADYSDEIFLGIKENREFEFTLEVNRFTKVFHSAVVRKSIGKLPARAKELLLWIIFELEPGVDYVIVNIARYEKENEVSHNTYLRAVEDLITSSVLCSTIWKGVFWINPAILFCGNRLKKFSDNVQMIEPKTKD